VLVTRSRSNAWVGSGPRARTPPRLPVAIGTDSLASAATLNLFDELARCDESRRKSRGGASTAHGCGRRRSDSVVITARWRGK
jgi:cytosine/adenosine deaminase-related metal-dependent hydrolase